VISERQTLQRIVDSGTDVAERDLNGAVADWTQDVTDQRPHGNENSKYPNGRPGRKHLAGLKAGAERGDGIADDLGKGHLDGNVDREQAQTCGNASRVMPKKSQDSQQAAGLPLLFSWRIRFAHQSVREALPRCGVYV
jgi:hypothetical protein